MKHLHFPVAILTHESGLVLAAASDYPKVALRLPDGYLTETATLQTKVSGDVSGQKTAKGELGTLTKTQTGALVTLHHCMSQSRKTARLGAKRREPGHDEIERLDGRRHDGV